MHRPQRAAVVAGDNAQDAGDACGADVDAHRLFDGVLVDAVDDDFVDRVDAFGNAEATLPSRVGR